MTMSDDLTERVEDAISLLDRLHNERNELAETVANLRPCDICGAVVVDAEKHDEWHKVVVLWTLDRR